MIKFCSLYSGSSGNALFMQYKNTRILIDAGLSGIKIQKALISIGEDPNDLDGILITHEHSDHTKGLGVLTRRYNLPIYINSSTWKNTKPLIGPVNDSNIYIFKSNEEFNIKDIKVFPFSIPHDASDPVGFNFFAGEKKLTTATDIGHMNNDILGKISNSDLLFLECNHDMEMLENGSYPYMLKRRVKGDYGHLCNDMAGKTIAHLAENGIKRFILGHLSNENNTPELAYKTVLNILSSKGFTIGEGYELDVALRDKTSRVFVV